MDPCYDKHPINDKIIINFLVRSLKNARLHIGSERIGKHIGALINLINIPEGSTAPKPRALGSTLATQSGAIQNDILTQGNWSSQGTIMIFGQVYEELSLLYKVEDTFDVPPTLADISFKMVKVQGS
ncbi:hypothetical protein BB559_007212 [Furculomyces boomerangus]|uniref:Uncharacterized protein n=1 Tax=Furculomyces boomerangus TaxID=61424 RepID=A0A2T9XYE8_9FUNG|nr:hypothetical protein BB559_007212 [Furculomyces boomerangus]